MMMVVETESARRYTSPQCSRLGIVTQPEIALEITNFISAANTPSARAEISIGEVRSNSEGVALTELKESLLRAIEMIDEIKNKEVK